MGAVTVGVWIDTGGPELLVAVFVLRAVEAGPTGRRVVLPLPPAAVEYIVADRHKIHRREYAARSEVVVPEVDARVENGDADAGTRQASTRRRAPYPQGQHRGGTTRVLQHAGRPRHHAVGGDAAHLRVICQHIKCLSGHHDCQRAQGQVVVEDRAAVVDDESAKRHKLRVGAFGVDQNLHEQFAAHDLGPWHGRLGTDTHPRHGLEVGRDPRAGQGLRLGSAKQARRQDEGEQTKTAQTCGKFSTVIHVGLSVRRGELWTRSCGDNAPEYPNCAQSQHLCGGYFQIRKGRSAPNVHSSSSGGPAGCGSEPSNSEKAVPTIGG